MRIRRWPLAVIMLVTSGCVGPWVTESHPVPAIDDGRQGNEVRQAGERQLSVPSPPTSVARAVGSTDVAKR